MKKHITLLELMIAVVIVGILASVGIPLYRNTIEKSKAKVCETNLKMLQAAIEIYGLENDVLPASLTQLRPGDFQKAWARVFGEENQWLIKSAYFLVDFDNRGLAYAQEGFVQRYLGGNLTYLTCPADPTPPDEKGVGSYGLNAALASQPFDSYKQAQQSDDFYVVVGDCEQPLFSSLDALVQRHTEGKMLYQFNPFAQFAATGGKGILGAQRKIVGKFSQRAGVDLPRPLFLRFPAPSRYLP